MPEGRGVFPTLSVREDLVMAARAGRDGRRERTLQRVLQTFPRLQERLDSLGAQLSGGEQQMLSIGRALMTHPELLMLDEATEGLAPRVVAEPALEGSLGLSEGTGVGRTPDEGRRVGRLLSVEISWPVSTLDPGETYAAMNSPPRSGRSHTHRGRHGWSRSSGHTKVGDTLGD